MADETRRVVVTGDVANEQVVLAAALVDLEARARLVLRLRPDQFVAHQQHRAAWAGVVEMERRKLANDPATLQRLAGDGVGADYVVALLEARPDAPANLDQHVEALEWDHARVVAAQGPVSSFLAALRDPREAPERTVALARQVLASLEAHRDRRHLRSSAEVARAQVLELRRRMAGVAVYPYGVAGLDEDEDGPRLLPGAAPCQVTVVTGVPGSGKSTLAARIVLGLARLRRRVLVGAWEMGHGTTLELLACLSLGYSRQALLRGQLGEEELAQVEACMIAIGRWVQFLDNPFRRERGERRSTNEERLDIIQGYVADSGCDVFVADLWRRALRDGNPDEEEFALYRQQAMAEEMGIHCILVQQQRSKDVEQRSDPHPTREGIKGTSAWVEVADTILGVYRPALHKRVDDNVLEVDVLKQRYGRWPIAVEFDWAGDTGMLVNARTVAYDVGAAVGSEDGGLFEPPRRKGKKVR